MNFAEFSQLSELSDEEFLAELANIRPYTACHLKKGPNFEPPGPDHTTGVTKIIRRHGKHNTALHRAGLLPIVCPISDDSELAGLGIFSATADEINEIMSEDPGDQGARPHLRAPRHAKLCRQHPPDIEIGNRNAAG